MCPMLLTELGEEREAQAQEGACFLVPTIYYYFF
jgi:hypothetical protein